MLKCKENGKNLNKSSSGRKKKKAGKKKEKEKQMKKKLNKCNMDKPEVASGEPEGQSLLDRSELVHISCYRNKRKTIHETQDQENQKKLNSI